MCITFYSIDDFTKDHVKLYAPVKEIKELIKMSVEKMLSVARGELGYLEKKSNSQLDDKTANAGYNNWTKYGRWYGINPGAWCDMFVSWCAAQAGELDAVGKFAWVKGHWEYFKNKGKTFRRGEKLPIPGDVIFLGDPGHVGIVEYVKNGRVYTIEGNTSSLSEYEPNGGCCREKSYTLNSTYIYGYGRPDYKKDEKQEDKKEDEDMTQEKFNTMFAIAMDSYRRSLKDNDSGTWSASDRDWVVQNQLIKGSSKLPDGNPNYMWEDFLTREQSAAIFHRMYTLIEKNFGREIVEQIVIETLKEQLKSE